MDGQLCVKVDMLIVDTDEWDQGGMQTQDCWKKKARPKPGFVVAAIIRVAMGG